MAGQQCIRGEVSGINAYRGLVSFLTAVSVVDICALSPDML